MKLIATFLCITTLQFMVGCNTTSPSTNSKSAAVPPLITNSADGIRINLAISDSPYNNSILRQPFPIYRHSTELSISPRDHFYVVLTNVSDHAINLIQESSSWGDEVLYFEFKDDQGKTYFIKKVPIDWDFNMLTYWTLHPGDPLVIEVCLGALRRDKPMWTGFPNLAQAVNGRMTAIYAPDTKMTPDDAELWTGHIRSEPIPCSLWLRR